MRHWTIGAVYKDHKRDTECTLVAISPYKAKTGSYLDFKYIDGKYIRQSSSKALSRFEMVGAPSQTGTGEIAYSSMILPDLKPAKNITSQVEAFIENTVARPMPKNKRVPKRDAPKWYANVIYIDFIKKCRIVVKL